MDSDKFEKFTPAELVRVIFNRKNPEEQIAAINALGAYKDQRSLNPLIHVVQNEQNLIVCVQAIFVLKDLNDHRAFDSLAALFTKEKTLFLLRAALVNLLASLDLKKSIPILIDAFQERNDLHSTIVLNILDILEYYHIKMPEKQISYIKEFLELLFDNSTYRKSWQISLAIAKTSALYGSLLGIKFLLYYKSKLKEFNHKNSQLILLNIDSILADLKENYFLSKETSDFSLFRAIEKRQEQEKEFSDTKK